MANPMRNNLMSMTDLMSVDELFDLQIPPNLSEIEKAEYAQRLVNQMGKAVAKMNQTHLLIGGMLFFAKETKIFKAYASHVKTWNDFIREIDIGINVAQANHMIRVFTRFGRQLRNDPTRRRIPFSRLLMIIPLCTGPDETEDWLNKADTLPHQAFLDEVREAKGMQPTDTCLHPDESMTKWVKCGVCHKWLRCDDSADWQATIPERITARFRMMSTSSEVSPGPGINISPAPSTTVTAPEWSTSVSVVELNRRARR